MERVLVLGAGQVGTFAAHALATEGVPIIVADLAPALGYFARFGPSAGKGAELVTVNMQDAAAIRALLKAHAVDAIVLCAGPVGAACDRDPQKAWEINVDATRQVAQTALSVGVKRLVLISTLAVYGRPAVDAIAETVPAHLNSSTAVPKPLLRRHCCPSEMTDWTYASFAPVGFTAHCVLAWVVIQRGLLNPCSCTQ